MIDVIITNIDDIQKDIEEELAYGEFSYECLEHVQNALETIRQKLVYEKTAKTSLNVPEIPDLPFETSSRYRGY